MNLNGSPVECILLCKYIILLHFEIHFIGKVMMSRYRYLWMRRRYGPANILDLKNPFFRYTGVQTQPPPGNNTQSSTETYWNSASIVLSGGIMNTAMAYAGQPSHGSGSCGFETSGWNMKNFRFFLDFGMFF